MKDLVNVYRRPKAATRILYELLRERSTEADANVNISHRKLPSWKRHVQFVASRPFRYWYLIEIYDDSEPLQTVEIAGYVSLSHLNEIGIVLFKKYRGMGYGKEAVRALTQKHKPLKAIPGKRSGHFIANINPSNGASRRMFEALGFRKIQETFALEEERNG